MSTTTTDIFAHYGRNIIRNHISNLPEYDMPKYRPAKAGDKVGVLGAGVGGLYAAIMLQSLNVPYEIIEGTKRVGGRLFTHKFEEGGFYDYYDVGAMRYPLPKLDEDGDYKPGLMQRVGRLFNYLGMQDKLTPYYYKSDKSPGFQYFNGFRARIGQGKATFNATELGISPSFIEIGPSAIVNDVISPFVKMLYNDLKNHTTEGWDIMRKNDDYSTRAYMCFKYIPSATLGLPPQHLSTQVVDWLETFNKSTGTYDRGLTQVVLSALSKEGDPEIEWKSIIGGSHVLPDTMEAFLTQEAGKSVIVKEAPVRKIGITSPSDANSSMFVVTADQTIREYSHVISTIPLPVLRTINLEEAGLSIRQTNALRALEYGPSVKVGILFTEPWWTTGEDRDEQPFDIVGGQSYTDLPIRTIIYPSHGAYTNEPSKTLIASYCWSSDAERLGSLIGTGQAVYEDQLKHLVLSNLASVHNVDFDYMESRFVNMHSWDWNHDGQTMGAYAFFGPGKFKDMYANMSLPAANGRLHFAGEALSIRHGWTVGALDSAWRAVYSYLCYTDPDKLGKFFVLWGQNAEWFDQKAGFGNVRESHKESSIFERYLRCTTGIHKQ